MSITNTQSGTRIDEIAERIYRISTPVPPNPVLPDGFTFNQFLVVDDEPLLFHTGLRRMFGLAREAMATVMPVDRLRWISFGHWEADETGALADWLAVAPNAAPLCGQIGAMLSVGDAVDRPARVLADGETVAIGTRRVRWFDTPHLPHGWDAGLLFEATTRTLFCGDLFTHGGATPAPVTDGDIIEPSERMRAAMSYYSNARDAGPLLDKLAATEPALLACMHGSSYRGDGAAALRELGARLRS
jgi:flavorubredoxin